MQRTTCFEQMFAANQHGAELSCTKCALRFHYVPRQGARMASVSTPSEETVNEALKCLSQLRDNDHTAKTARTIRSDVEGRKLRKKKPQSQTTTEYNPVHNSGAGPLASAYSTSTPRQQEPEGNPQDSHVIRRWRLLIVSLLQEERMMERQGELAKDGRGCMPVKTLSSRIERKLQHRWLILVSWPLYKKLLDAGRSERSDLTKSVAQKLTSFT